MTITHTNVATFLLASITLALPADAAQLAIVSNTRFVGTVNGTGGPRWTQIAVFPSYLSPTEPRLQSAARADGASNWDRFTPTNLNEEWTVSNVSQVDPIVSAALNGSWQVDFGAGPRGLNTTAGYRSISTAAVTGLTAQGVADMLAINASGVAGTYSLAVDQPIESLLTQGWSFYYQYEDNNGFHFGDLTNSTLSLDLQAGFGEVSAMVISAYRGTYSATSADGIFFAVSQGATVEYNFNAIPAPGAIALLGLAGLTRRSRR